MKKLYAIMLLIGLFPFIAAAQTLSPTVVASSGGFASASNGSLSYTVGEMTMVQTFASANNFLTQGFQQPEDLFLSIPEISVTSGTLTIYPNPTSGTFSLQYTGDEDADKVVSMYNSLGQLVKQLTIHQITGVNKIDFDITGFAQGIYIVEMKLRNNRGDLVPVYNKLNLLK